MVLMLLKDKRFQTLIALMLSSQTKDTTNAIAMRRLQTELPSPGLTLENILEVDPVKLNELIYVVGFHNNKTRYIKAAALILKDDYAGDIPDTIEGLMSLPGVGPKMAYLCLSAAWGRTEGIGVDVHVHRITNLWGWHKTKAPEETRASLEAWFVLLQPNMPLFKIIGSPETLSQNSCARPESMNSDLENATGCRKSDGMRSIICWLDLGKRFACLWEENAGSVHSVKKACVPRL